MKIILALLGLCCVSTRALVLGTPALAPRGAARPTARTLTPRGPPPAALADAPLLLDATTTLLAEDFFGKVFLAGMSIAAAAVGATVFVGFIVRNRYDDIESSYFQAQDDELSRQNAADQKQTASGDQTARDFFGDVNAREETPSDDR